MTTPIQSQESMNSLDTSQKENHQKNNHHFSLKKKEENWQDKIIKICLLIFQVSTKLSKLTIEQPKEINNLKNINRSLLHFSKHFVLIFFNKDNPKVEKENMYEPLLHKMLVRMGQRQQGNG